MTSRISNPTRAGAAARCSACEDLPGWRSLEAQRCVDDTGATFSIVRLERVAELRGDEFEQCKRWHLAPLSETRVGVSMRPALFSPAHPSSYQT
jgi:hypothetical protein